MIKKRNKIIFIIVFILIIVATVNVCFCTDTLKEYYTGEEIRGFLGTLNNGWVCVEKGQKIDLKDLDY